jgi:hypothetical protein
MRNLLLALALILSANQLSAEIIPLDRRIAWSPGVRGGIPNRSNIINVRNAPYNATGNGTTDDWTAIQNAIDAASAGQVVYLPQGTYRIGAGLSINKAISLRGDGPDKTTINYTGSSGIDILETVSGGNPGSAVAITGGNSKDSLTIRILSASSISVNDYILITQNNVSGLVYTQGSHKECNWCGSDNPSQAMTQINRVLAKSGNTLTLERPLYFDYTNSPVIKRLKMVENVGFEDFLLRRSNPSARNGYNLYLRNCANCWVKNVKSDMAGHRHVQLESSYACTVRDSWFSDGYDHSSDYSYGVFLFGWNSDNLIENNIVYRCRHSLILEGGGSGNVFGYNYVVGSLTTPDNDWLAEDMDTHGAHPFMNLFEGNVVGKLTYDNTWGSGSHNTTFRCWIRNYSSNAKTPTLARWAVDVEAHNYYNNIVGSLIGRPGDVGVRYAKENISGTILASYRLGFQSAGSNTVSDPNVQARTLIHGNYDSIGGGVVWDSSNSDHNLPASLYLSAKPIWFGSLAWPAFGPDLSPMVGTIPAKVRYESGTVGPQPAQLMPPSNLSVVP